MHLRIGVAFVALACLFAVPVALADDDDEDAKVKGDITWTIPPDVFGAEVGNDLRFDARKTDEGDISGHIHYEQAFQGELFVFDIDVTCLVVYDGGTRAKLGGIITESNDATIPVGRYGWFSALDLGKSTHDPPDRSSLLGFGDEAANEAFCNSPNLPRRSWDVEGNIKIRE